MMSVASSTTPGSRLEFVQHAFDLDGSNGCAFNRAQQHATKRVADGGTETTLEGLSPEVAVLVS